MKTPALERTSAAKAGWVIIVLTIAWSVFLLLPDPPPPPAVVPAPVPVPATSLTRSGLREYADWEGLPEIFALWADRADWKDDRTRFAYWHPGTKDYSYFFEAVRTAAGYRFREIPEPSEVDHHWDESLGADCPLRFYLPDPRAAAPGPKSEPPLPGPVPAVEKPTVMVPVKKVPIPAGTPKP
jgi:hypothetical protein